VFIGETSSSEIQNFQHTQMMQTFGQLVTVFYRKPVTSNANVRDSLEYKNLIEMITIKVCEHTHSYLVTTKIPNWQFCLANHNFPESARHFHLPGAVYT